MFVDYLINDTRESISDFFLTMTDSELAEMLLSLRTACNAFNHGSYHLVSSSIYDYLETVYDIAQNVLTFRFTEEWKTVNSR